MPKAAKVIKSNDTKEWEVRRILGAKTENGKKFFLVQWKPTPVSDIADRIEKLMCLILTPVGQAKRKTSGMKSFRKKTKEGVWANTWEPESGMKSSQDLIRQYLEEICVSLWITASKYPADHECNSHAKPYDYWWWISQNDSTERSKKVATELLPDKARVVIPVSGSGDEDDSESEAGKISENSQFWSWSLTNTIQQRNSCSTKDHRNARRNKSLPCLHD